MTKKIISLLCITSVLLILSQTQIQATTSKQSEFADVVKLIETHYKVTHRGLPRLVKMGIGVARVAGGLKQFGGIKLATFENQDFASNSKDAIFAAKLRELVRPAWRTIVETRSQAEREQTFVFVREAGKSINILVVNIEPRDATAVQVKISRQKLLQLMREPKEMRRNLANDAGEERRDKQ